MDDETDRNAPAEPMPSAAPVAEPSSKDPAGVSALPAEPSEAPAEPLPAPPANIPADGENAHMPAEKGVESAVENAAAAAAGGTSEGFPGGPSEGSEKAPVQTGKAKGKKEKPQSGAPEKKDKQSSTPDGGAPDRNAKPQSGAEHAKALGRTVFGKLSRWAAKAAEKGKLLLKRYDELNYTCDLCGREVFEGEHICKVCMPLLPWNLGVICPKCGRKLKEPGLCLECRETPPVVDYARSLFTHEGDAAKLVVEYKRGKRYLYRAFAELELPFLARFPEADAVTFVPMTERAERARGYNQSRLLAEEIAAKSGLCLLAPAVKTRETGAQKFLGKKERAENLKGSFSVKDRASVKGRKIIILDDTFTTGATVNELAAVLKRAGAEKVFALTVTSVENKARYGAEERAEPPRAEGEEGAAN